MHFLLPRKITVVVPATGFCKSKFSALEGNKEQARLYLTPGFLVSYRTEYLLL